MPSVRPATSKDTDGILSLVGEVYAEYACVLDLENEEKYLLEAGEFFRASGGEFWVVEDEGRIEATVAVFLSEGAGELKTLYVHRSLRRQGWGRRLVELATEHARRAGRARMFLWSDTRFIEAHRLYRSMGFEECGLRELKDVNNSVEYGFEKRLR
jgi:putative acetyltransferase